MLTELQRPCGERAPLFNQARESATLIPRIPLIGEMLEKPAPQTTQDTP
jgi:hypothetical protein